MFTLQAEFRGTENWTCFFFFMWSEISSKSTCLVAQLWTQPSVLTLGQQGHMAV